MPHRDVTMLLRYSPSLDDFHQSRAPRRRQTFSSTVIGFPQAVDYTLLRMIQPAQFSTEG